MTTPFFKFRICFLFKNSRNKQIKAFKDELEPVRHYS